MGVSVNYGTVNRHFARASLFFLPNAANQIEFKGLMALAAALGRNTVLTTLDLASVSLQQFRSLQRFRNS